MPRIKLVKEKRTIECPVGANLRQVLLQNGVEVYAGIAKRMNCHGGGKCGTCRVYIKEGVEAAGEKTLRERLREALAFFTIGHEEEARLSCQTTVEGDMTVETTPDFNWYGKDVWKYTTREAGE